MERKAAEREIMERKMNIERTRRHYNSCSKEELCQCAYCRTYTAEIKTALPQMATYLDSIGVDIEKPFEVLPLDETEEEMEYMGAQYLVLGAPEGFSETTVEKIPVLITDSHPSTQIPEKHFVIEIVFEDPLRLRR